MGVGADDHIHTVLLHQIHNLGLGFADLVAVDAAPVEHSHGDIRLLGGNLTENAGNALLVHLLIVGIVVGVQQVHAVLTARRKAHAAQALGKGHKGHLNALNIADGIAAGFVEIRGGGVGSQRLHARSADIIQGGVQADEAIIDGIGVRHLNQVHAYTFQIGQQFRGGGSGFGAVGLPAEVALHIHNRHIPHRQLGSHIHESPAEIIARGADAGVHHGIGDIQVAYGADVDGGNGVLGSAAGLGGRLGGGRGGGRCFADGGHRRCLVAGGQLENRHAAAHQDHQRASRQQKHSSAPPLLHPPGRFPLLPPPLHIFPIQCHSRHPFRELFLLL